LAREMRFRTRLRSVRNRISRLVILLGKRIWGRQIQPASHRLKTARHPLKKVAFLHAVATPRNASALPRFWANPDLGFPMTVADWTHPPPGVEPISLWEALHDGELMSIVTDRLDRSVRLSVVLPHLNERLSLPEEMLFTFSFRGVRSLRGTAFRLWPGEYVRDPSHSRSDEEAAIRAFHAKGREESVGFDELESSIANWGFSVLNAEMIEGRDEQSYFFRGTAGEDEISYTLILRAESLTIERPDGVSMSLGELLRIGEEVWAARRRP
jgi:hypothetical protein